MLKTKNYLKLKHRHSGLTDEYKELRIINTVALLATVFYNSMNYYLNPTGITDLLSYTLIFLILSIVVLKVKNELVLYGVYTLVGSLTIVFAERVIEYSGLIYILFACGVKRDVKYQVTTFLISFISLSIRLTKLNDNIPTTIQMMILFCFLSYTAYVIFFKRKKRNIDLWKSIKEEHKPIIKMYARGYSYDKIIKQLKLNIQEASVRKIITRARELSGCENDIQFGKWLYEKG